jgi:hypothetical protein
MKFLLLLALLSVFSEKDFPGSSGVILEEKVKTEIEKNGKINTLKEVKIFILNKRGREKFGNLFQKYNEKTEKIEILEVYTEDQKGVRYKPSKKGISDLSAAETFLAPQYSNLKTKTVVFSKVDPGNILYYKSLLKSKKPKKDKYFFGREIFGRDEPILHKEFILKFPKVFSIKTKVIGEEIKYRRREEEDFVIYEFYADTLERIKRETGMVPLITLAPRVYFSNFSSWDEVAEFLWNKFKGSQKNGKKLKKELNFLKGEGDTLKALYNFITKSVKDIPLTLGETGYEPTDVVKIFKNRYGDSKDKSALLITLLDICGIEAFPAYVSYTEIVKDIPSPSYFDCILVAVPEGDGYIFLDTRFPERPYFSMKIRSILSSYNGGFYLPSGIPGREAFIVKGGRGEFYKIPLPSPSDYSSETVLNAEIKGDGTLEGSFDAILKGFYAERARKLLKGKNEEERKREMEKLVSRIKIKTKLKDYEITGLEEPLSPVRIRVSFSSEDYLTQLGDGRFIFNLPPNILGFDSINRLMGLERREHPLDALTSRALKYTVTLKIPENFKVEYMPEEFSYEDSISSFYCEFLMENKKITIKKGYSLKKRFYTPDEYMALIKPFSEVTKSQRKTIILKEEDK